MNSKTFHLLQITDTHLGKDEGDTLLGLNTECSMRDVLESICQSGVSYDLIVASGDISCDGTAESYNRFISLVNEYLPGIPLAWLEGNHDDPAGMRAISHAQPLCDAVSLGNWRVILLNSRVDGEVGGALATSELRRLDALLAQEPDCPTMIFLHHQPVPVGSAWIDQYVVSNAPEFFSVLDKYTNVKLVCWGHVHQIYDQQRNGVSLIASPSTCVQFAQNSTNFAVDPSMPGYRSFTLSPDGAFDSTVERISERAYPIDFASSGY